MPQTWKHLCTPKYPVSATPEGDRVLEKEPKWGYQPSTPPTPTFYPSPRPTPYQLPYLRAEGKVR